MKNKKYKKREDVPRKGLNTHMSLINGRQTGLTLGTRRGVAPLPEMIAVTVEVSEATFRKRGKLSPAQRYNDFLSWDERLAVRERVRRRWNMWYDAYDMQLKYLNELRNSRSNLIDKEWQDLSIDNSDLHPQSRIGEAIATKLFEGVLWFERGDRDLVVATIERIMCLGYQLSRSRSIPDIMVAVSVFVTPWIETSMTSCVLMMLASFVGEVFAVDESGPDLHFQDMPTFDSVKEMLANYEKFKDSTLWKKLYRVMAYACSLGLFSKLGLNIDSATYGVYEKHLLSLNVFTGTDFVIAMVETVLHILEIGYQCFKTGDLAPMLMKGKDYEEWMKEVTELKQLASSVSTLEAFGTDRFEYLQRLNDAIDVGNMMLRWFKPDQALEKRFVRASVNDITMIKNSLLTRDFASQERPAPFACLMYGGTSVGKSSFTALLYQYYGKLCGLNTDDSYKYPRNPANSYWDNFNTSQWCIQFDEIGFLRSDKSQGLDETLKEVLQVLNTIPYVPVMADVSDKGKTPVRAELVLATTNVQDLNAPDYFMNAAAVMRRWNMIIDLVPKPEFATPDLLTIDSTKIPPLAEGSFPDYWDIVVKKAKPKHRSKVQAPGKRPLIYGVNDDMRMNQVIDWVIMGRYDNIYNFLEFFKQQVETHKSTQSSVTDCTETMRRITLCDACKMPEKHCRCIKCQQCGLKECACGLSAQSLVSDLGSGWSRFTSWIFRKLMRGAVNLYLKYRPIRTLVNNSVSSEVIDDVVNHTLDPGAWKRLMFDAGVRAAKQLAKPPVLVALAGSLALGLWWLKKYREVSGHHCSDLFFPQVLSLNDIKKQPFDQDSIWYKSDYQTTPVELGSKTMSWKGKSRDWIIETLEPNLCLFKMWHSEHVSHLTRAVCVADKLYAVNAHAIPQGTFKLDVVRGPVQEGICGNVYGITVFPSHVYRSPHTEEGIYSDIGFIWIDCIPARKSLLELLPKSSLRGIHQGFYVQRTERGVLKQVGEVVSSTYTRCILPKFGASEMFHGICSRSTEPGDCGSIFISEQPMGPVILGIHAMGDNLKRTKQVMVAPLWREQVQKVLNLFTPVVVDMGRPRVVHEDLGYTLGDVHEKSPLRYIPEGSLEVYGTLQGPRSHPKSRVKPTLISAYLKDRGFKTEHGKPVMTGWEPKHNALVDIVKPHCEMDPTVLTAARKAYVEDALSRLEDGALASLGVVDLDVAINGVWEIAHMDRINISSSTGYPYKCPKKKKLVPKTSKGLDGPLDVDDDIYLEILDILDAYKSGRRANPVNSANLKDEALKKSKIDAKLTRMFCGAPMAWVIVVRKYLLTILRLIYTHHIAFESAPGIAANSYEWHDMIEQVALWPNRCIDGDFKAFDKTMKARVIKEVFMVFYDIAKASNQYSEEELSIILLIGEDTAYPWFDFFGDVIMVFGMNSSGNPATVIINGIANSLYMRYAYYNANPEKECFTFRKFVNLMTYGDDNWQSISPECQFYHHNAIQNELAKVNITYTSADKKLDAPDFKDVDDCSFLKRSMRFSEELGCRVGCLETSSIHKMLMLCVESKSVPEEVQCVQQIRSALDEYFFYGKEKYESMRKLLFQAAMASGLRSHMTHEDVPSWESQLERFEISASKRTFR